MKRKKKPLIMLARERTVLAKERTTYANIRTVLAGAGVLILLAKLFDIISWWPILGVAGLFTGVIITEDIIKLVKLKRKENALMKKTKI